jgi:50S ribosomal protein L16 3-hydroxylase
MLGDISIETFLREYWQKKPLLIRNAFTDMKSPVSADELAGLACEEHVNARLVFEHGEDSEGPDERPWQVEFGPFDEERFTSLPDRDWSLLVSDVEKHLPETAYLLEPFRFIPDWRIDDLMISYAPPGGSVGPHTDAYDVFLIQLSGQRLWKISQDYPTETLPDTDLCILKGFSAEDEWVLSAGDMLYLPPNVAHHGIAQQSLSDDGEESPCLTGSVGFRAPSLKTISSDYVNYLNENVHEDIRYSDASPSIASHHAEISEQTVAEFIDYIRQGFTIDHEYVRRWLGQYCSDNKTYDELLGIQYCDGIDQLVKQVEENGLQQSPYSNFLFSRSGDGALLFVNGNTYQTSTPFAETLCDSADIDLNKIRTVMDGDDEDTLLTLFNSGAIISESNG